MNKIFFKKHIIIDTLRVGILSISLLAAVGVVTLMTSGRALAAPAALNSTQSVRARIAGSILQDIQHATWISEGHNKHVIYIFFDPNCPYCHKLYEEFRPWVKRNEVQLRWLPIGTLMASSRGKAAAILQAKNPLAAFRRNEQGFSPVHGFGRIGEEPLPKPAIKKALNINAELLDRTGQEAVPTMVFRVKDGTPIFIQGSPPPRFLGQIVDQLE